MKLRDHSVAAVATGALMLASLVDFASAANKPCSGKKGGVSHCNGTLFVCKDGSISQSKKVCDAGPGPAAPAASGVARKSK